MKKIKVLIFSFVLVAGLGFICTFAAWQTTFTNSSSFINPTGTTVNTRILTPPLFQRIENPNNSFGYYLSHLPVKPHGSKVLHYNGNIKTNDVHVAVIDLPIGKKDLHQCADAVIHLRARYLFEQKQYDSIHFNFTNGFNATFAKWRQGYRIVVNGNKASWVLKSTPSISETVFWQYLEMVFSYAGTLSLSKELKAVPYGNMQTGDVLIQGGSPGHAVIVVDMAINKQSGKKIFLLAQSYMPAQELHILKNDENPLISPWYELDATANLIITPEWTFKTTDLKRF